MQQLQVPIATLAWSKAAMQDLGHTSTWQSWHLYKEIKSGFGDWLPESDVIQYGTEAIDIGLLLDGS